ncbi:MAG: VWA domain-containing protein [Nitrospinae bacterium]|nr:VWA domain-containing protein [Nitrospinota bacterium]
MRFGRPEYLHFLWTIVPLALFLIWAARRKRRALARFCSPQILGKLLDERCFQKQRTKAVLTVLAIAAMIVALAQPRWGSKWEELRQEGVDLVVAMDVSNSMLAADVKPDRLTRARRKVADLLNMLEGDRVGLVAFAGTSFIQCPLTLDYSAVAIFLDALDTGLLPVQGTDIGGALRTSLKAFSGKEKKSKAIILITDGEDQRGNALEAAREAREQGARIFAIGVGQELGAPIPNLEQGGFKKDRAGDMVLAKLDESTLQKIAIETGGSYARSVTGDMDLNKIYLEDIKNKVEKKELKTTRRQLWQERFQWLAFFSVICLSLEFILREN